MKLSRDDIITIGNLLIDTITDIEWTIEQMPTDSPFIIGETAYLNKYKELLDKLAYMKNEEE